MSFDEIIDRRGSHCVKWDMMETLYGVPEDDGIAMWVADMDFRPPQSVLDSVQRAVDHGIFGYHGDDRSYRAAICWWMRERHGWEVDPSWIFTTSGLVNGAAVCLESFTRRGDGVVLFTPVYHAFARVIRAAEREVVECEMVKEGGVYGLDIARWDTQMTGNEKMLILCSPHNPGGRVWTLDELEQIAEFARRHDLLIVSDEVHHDVVYPGARHIPMATLSGIEDRLVMMTAPSKTFNIAGAHTGQVIIADPELRAAFGKRMAGLGKSPNSFGLFMTEAAYSPEGAAWVDELIPYLDGNRKLLDSAVNAIPGLASMPMQSTYLAWVDFSGTGMQRAEFTARVEKQARIAANHGPSFGKGGDSYLRFNFATPRSVVETAMERLTAAFADLQ
ncbi:cystathionine beta-lyase [Aliiruegeria haliotis]|uniref:cysteine-S-conjugate beta-lyase n=1 Tax=Aliiruegeria haliotis TaxID=1280846 RepID=A0A2T0RJ60_9RHOB|nr:MalY/PatB family protein [Aliiruegeria haliotis]PRY21150.1 cystathionine beta-lyase [Aliiruegeria haliotis]